jgi:hypothetical protein
LVGELIANLVRKLVGELIANLVRKLVGELIAKLVGQLAQVSELIGEKSISKLGGKLVRKLIRST